jgi:hypothetical protein
MYDLYKPFRNYMRQFPLLPSLEYIWVYSEHIANGLVLPPALRFRNSIGGTVNLKDTIFPWELDLLAREIVLNAGTDGTRSLGTWHDVSTTINLIRHIENGISSRYTSSENVLRELHRIVHRQFPWQSPPSTSSMMRYLKIFGGGDMDPIVSRETGLNMKQFYKVGLAIGGHFRKQSRMSTNQDYRVIGVNAEMTSAFFSRLTTDVATLRKATKAQQRYDDGWAYSWNPLRACPLVSFDPNNPDRILCPIPSFLMRRVSEGIFYDIAGREGFENAYGLSFQKYVGDALKEICPSPKFEIIDEEEYKVGKYRKDGVDWIVMDETANIFIECKAKRLRQDAKFVTDGDGLAAALDVMAGYIVQHYKNIQDALDGKTKWKRNNRPIFPIVITLENWRIFTPPIVGILTTQIKARLDRASIDHGCLESMPYTVASIEEFEIAAQVMAQVGILPFLGLKTDQTHREWALSPFSPGLFPDEVKQAHLRLFSDEWMKLGEP